MERRDGRLIVPCGLCGIQTPMTGTKRCDPCWQLERCVEARPVQARQLTGATTLVEQRDRLAAALRKIRTAATSVASYDRALADIKKLAKDALATIEQSSPSTTDDEQGGGKL